MTSKTCNSTEIRECQVRHPPVAVAPTNYQPCLYRPITRPNVVYPHGTAAHARNSTWACMQDEMKNICSVPGRAANPRNRPQSHLHHTRGPTEGTCFQKLANPRPILSANAAFRTGPAVLLISIQAVTTTPPNHCHSPTHHTDIQPRMNNQPANKTPHAGTTLTQV